MGNRPVQSIKIHLLAQISQAGVSDTNALEQHSSEMNFISLETESRGLVAYE